MDLDTPCRRSFHHWLDNDAQDSEEFLQSLKRFFGIEIDYRRISRLTSAMRNPVPIIAHLFHLVAQLWGDLALSLQGHQDLIREAAMLDPLKCILGGLFEDGMAKFPRQGLDAILQMITHNCFKHGEKDKDAELLQRCDGDFGFLPDVLRFHMFEMLIEPDGRRIHRLVFPVTSAQTPHPKEVDSGRFIPRPGIKKGLHRR
jgi:hypothetical protein